MATMQVKGSKAWPHRLEEACLSATFLEELNVLSFAAAILLDVISDKFICRYTAPTQLMSTFLKRTPIFLNIFHISVL
jgi:hypothetical protein